MLVLAVRQCRASQSLVQAWHQLTPSAAVASSVSCSRDTGPWKTRQLSSSAGRGEGPDDRDKEAGPQGPSLASLAASLSANLHSTPSPAAVSAQPVGKADLFTQALQHKTQQQLLNIIATTRDNKLAGAPDNVSAAQAQAEEEEEAEQDSDFNPKTGEYGGPRGKEPTRYGDWDVKGRCSDF